MICFCLKAALWNEQWRVMESSFLNTKFLRKRYFFQRKSKIHQTRSLPFFSSESTQILYNKPFFFLLLYYSLALRWPIESKFAQVCYFMQMLEYTNKEDWSLTSYPTCPVPFKLHPLDLCNELFIFSPWTISDGWKLLAKQKNISLPLRQCTNMCHCCLHVNAGTGKLTNW